MVNILGNDDEKPRNGKTYTQSKPIKDNSQVITIVLIMGLVLLVSLFIAVKPVPEIPSCPNITIPQCNECPTLICPEITIPECPSMICGNNTMNETYTTEYMNFTLTSLTIFNSTNFNQNATYYLNASITFNQTAEINTTTLGLGELLVIRVDYE